MRRNLRYTKLALALVAIGSRIFPYARGQAHFVRNVALRKEASQSTTYQVAVASRAVDGNTNPHFDGGSVSHTLSSSATDDFIFWKVDLGASYLIERILVFHRHENYLCGEESCINRAKGYIVEIQDDNGLKLWDWAHDENENVTRREILEVNQPVLGSTVMIKILVSGQSNTLRILQLAEVEVYGAALYNVAFGMPVSQSSTDLLGVAGKAVDGNTNGVYNEGSSHTNSGGTQWWRVNLGKSFTIYYIKIYNRSNQCCNAWLSGYTLTVLNAGSTVHTFTHAGGTPPDASVLSIPAVIGDEVVIHLSSGQPLNLAEVQVLSTEQNTFFIENAIPANLGKVLKPVSCLNGAELQVANIDRKDAAQLFYYTSDGMIGSYGCNQREPTDIYLTTVSPTYYFIPQI